MIGRSGERGSGISVLVARHDDNDDYIYIYIYIQGEVDSCFSNGIRAMLIEVALVGIWIQLFWADNYHTVVDLLSKEGKKITHPTTFTIFI